MFALPGGFRRSVGTFVSARFFISLANYGAPLRGWRLVPPVFTLEPAICRASVSSCAGYSWLRASPASCQVNTYPHPGSLAGQRSLTRSPRVLHADRPRFLLWDSSPAGPLRRYRWRCGLWHFLWPLPPDVMLLRVRQLVQVWGAALPTGPGVRMMIAFWPRPALHYIHNETFTSSTAACKW